MRSSAAEQSTDKLSLSIVSTLWTRTSIISPWSDDALHPQMRLPCSLSVLRDHIADSVEEFFLARGPSSSAEVRGLVIHDIKEVEGVRQQEDKRDEERGDEVNGEVEEVTQRAHET